MRLYLSKKNNPMLKNLQITQDVFNDCQFRISFCWFFFLKCHTYAFAGLFYIEKKLLSFECNLKCKVWFPQFHILNRFNSSLMHLSHNNFCYSLVIDKTSDNPLHWNVKGKLRTDNKRSKKKLKKIELSAPMRKKKYKKLKKSYVIFIHFWCK